MSDLDIVMHWEQILVDPEALPKQTPGGIEIPDTVELEIDNMRTGIVVKVGPGLRSPDGEWLGCATSVGSRVVYHKRVGEPVIINDGAYRLMGDRDIRMTIGPDVVLSKIMARVPAKS